MKRSVPPAVLEISGDPTRSEPRYWYERELTIEELTETVGVINRALRSS